MVRTHHQFGAPELLTVPFLGKFYPDDLIARRVLGFFSSSSVTPPAASQIRAQFLVQEKIKKFVFCRKFPEENCWRLTENPENIFLCAGNFRKFFPGKSVHAYTRYPELFPTSQKTVKNLSKSHFSDVNTMAGSQGHLLPVSPGNPAINKCQKTMPPKARYFAGSKPD